MDPRESFGGLLVEVVVTRHTCVSLGEQAKKMGPEMTLGPVDWWRTVDHVPIGFPS